MVERRSLLVAGVGALGALLAGLVGYPFWSYLVSGRKEAIRQARFAIGDVPPGGGLLVRLGRRPLLVLSDGEGRLRGLWARCPHLGCAVGWDAPTGQIVCPCHDGRFDRDGRRLAGPPERDLEPAAVEFRVEGGSTVVVREV